MKLAQGLYSAGGVSVKVCPPHPEDAGQMSWNLDESGVIHV